MTCQKCMGLMIEEQQPDLSPEEVVHRCINCGLVLDSLIRQNRGTRGRGKDPLLHAA